MKPEDFVRTLWKERAGAILRTDDQRVAHEAMEAAVRGGFRILEFTMGCPDPYELIREFSGREGLVVGAGTVLTEEQAHGALEAGAGFLVSPVTDEAIIGIAREAGVAAMPGTHTPNEMLRAWRAGAQLQKLFPPPGAGPAYVRACLGPLPFLRIVPTSGVDAENVGEWLAAGVWAVAFVGSLFDAELLERGDYEALERRAKRCLEAARSAPRPDRGAPVDPFSGENRPAPVGTDA